LAPGRGAVVRSFSAKNVEDSLIVLAKLAVFDRIQSSPRRADPTPRAVASISSWKSVIQPAGTGCRSRAHYHEKFRFPSRSAPIANRAKQGIHKIDRGLSFVWARLLDLMGEDRLSARCCFD
jgi:hypothetical protein